MRPKEALIHLFSVLNLLLPLVYPYLELFSHLDLLHRDCSNFAQSGCSSFLEMLNFTHERVWLQLANSAVYLNQ